MKNSIWLKLFAGIMVLLTSIFALMIVLNSTYLEKYYLKVKKEKIITFSKEVKESFKGDVLEIEDLLLEADKQSIGNIVIYDKNGQLAYPIYDTPKRLARIPSASTDARIRGVLKRGLKLSKSVFVPHENKALGTKSYLLATPLAQGYTMTIISPLEPMKESIEIVNKFNYYIMFISLILGFILAIIYTKYFTKPIVELNAMAKGMSKLDFSRRFRSKSQDEISELGETINQLAQNLDSKIKELNNANIQLKEDIDIKQQHEKQRKELISNISHELKTPIALIQGYGEGLRESIITDPEDKDYYCDVIIDEATKMNKLVMELLDLSHLESGHYNLDPIDFDLVLLSKHVINKYKDIVTKKNLNLKLINDYPSALLKADPYRIEQVIKNLINNAIDHANDNGIIEISINKTNDSIKFSIYNTGSNIDDSELKNIWGSFYKLDKARSRELGGTGLGLAITKGILDLHNFKYGVYNTADGVTFWFSNK